MSQEALPPIVNFAAVDFWYHNRAHSEIQLTTRLSLSTKVLFVNSIGMRAPLPGRSSNTGFRIWRKAKSLFRGLRKPLEDYPNFYVFSPIIIPAYSTPWLRKFNYVIVRYQVHLAMMLLRIKNPIVIETIPTANDIVKKMKSRIEIINRVDKMSAFGETDQDYIASLEREQISRADRTYYTSQTLLDEEASWHQGKGRFLDHGVDIKLFSPRTDSTPLPDELTDLSQILGFFGGIDDYVIDIELLENIAHEFPHCTLVLIGEATCDISTLKKMKNVRLLGFRSITEVARLGAFFDVALLPRKNDEWTQYTNPIKIKEYLALGLPIVTMDIPEVRIYTDDIFIANSPKEFIDLVRTALETPSTSDSRSHLRSLVETDTWDNRCEEVLADMKDLLSCAE